MKNYKIFGKSILVVALLCLALGAEALAQCGCGIRGPHTHNRGAYVGQRGAYVGQRGAYVGQRGAYAGVQGQYARGNCGVNNHGNPSSMYNINGTRVRYVNVPVAYPYGYSPYGNYGYSPYGYGYGYGPGYVTPAPYNYPTGNYYRR